MGGMIRKRNACPHRLLMISTYAAVDARSVIKALRGQGNVSLGRCPNDGG